MLPSRRYGTTAARIVVRAEDASAVETSEHWPDHVYVRPWAFEPHGGPDQGGRGGGAHETY